MDLSKAFDSLNHSLMIAKLKAYGFDDNAINFIRSYFENRLQCCKINDSFSSLQNVFAGVPQGSILGPLFFNIFINDIFFFLDKCSLGNYADDSTLYTSGKNLNEILHNLKNDFSILASWFHKNFMVLNPG